jgi:hypothetical protein
MRRMLVGIAAALADLSPSGRLKKLREKEQKLREPSLGKLNSAKALVESKIKEVERRISAPPAPDEEGLRRQNNIVAAIREMKPDDRLELLNKMDKEIAAAVLRNHPVALGMTTTEQDLFRLAWQKRRHAAGTDQLARDRKALAHIERAVPIVVAYCEKKMASLNPVHVSSY